MRQGDNADGMYFVEDGEVIVRMTGDDDVDREVCLFHSAVSNLYVLSSPFSSSHYFRSKSFQKVATLANWVS